MLNASYYQLLGLNLTGEKGDGSTYSPKEIKSAYYKKSKECHPDKRTGSNALFKKILEAYEVLSNARKRLEYDRELRENPLLFIPDKDVFIKKENDSKNVEQGSVSPDKFVINDTLSPDKDQVNLTQLFEVARYTEKDILFLAENNPNFALSIINSKKTLEKFTKEGLYSLFLLIFNLNKDKDFFIKEPMLTHLWERFKKRAELFSMENAFTRHPDIAKLFIETVPECLMYFDKYNLIRLSRIEVIGSVIKEHIKQTRWSILTDSEKKFISSKAEGRAEASSGESPEASSGESPDASSSESPDEMSRSSIESLISEINSNAIFLSQILNNDPLPEREKNREADERRLISLLRNFIFIKFIFLFLELDKNEQCKIDEVIFCEELKEYFLSLEQDDFASYLDGVFLNLLSMNTNHGFKDFLVDFIINWSCDESSLPELLISISQNDAEIPDIVFCPLVLSKLLESEVYSKELTKRPAIFCALLRAANEAGLNSSKLHEYASDIMLELNEENKAIEEREKAQQFLSQYLGSKYDVEALNDFKQFFEAYSLTGYFDEILDLRTDNPDVRFIILRDALVAAKNYFLPRFHRVFAIYRNNAIFNVLSSFDINQQQIILNDIENLGYRELFFKLLLKSYSNPFDLPVDGSGCLDNILRHEYCEQHLTAGYISEILPVFGNDINALPSEFFSKKMVRFNNFGSFLVNGMDEVERGNSDWDNLLASITSELNYIGFDSKSFEVLNLVFEKYPAVILCILKKVNPENSIMDMKCGKTPKLVSRLKGLVDSKIKDLEIFHKESLFMFLSEAINYIEQTDPNDYTFPLLSKIYKHHKHRITPFLRERNLIQRIAAHELISEIFEESHESIFVVKEVDTQSETYIESIKLKFVEFISHYERSIEDGRTMPFGFMPGFFSLDKLNTSQMNNEVRILQETMYEQVYEQRFDVAMWLVRAKNNGSQWASEVLDNWLASESDLRKVALSLISHDHSNGCTDEGSESNITSSCRVDEASLAASSGESNPDNIYSEPVSLEQELALKKRELLEKIERRIEHLNTPRCFFSSGTAKSACLKRLKNSIEGIEINENTLPTDFTDAIRAWENTRNGQRKTNHEVITTHRRFHMTFFSSENTGTARVINDLKLSMQV